MTATRLLRTAPNTKEEETFITSGAGKTVTHGRLKLDLYLSPWTKMGLEKKLISRPITLKPLQETMQLLSLCLMKDIIPYHENLAVAIKE